MTRAARSSLLGVPLVCLAWQGDAADRVERVHVSSTPMTRTSLARERTLGEEARPRQSPFWVARRDGSLLLGCVEWTPGKGDRIVLSDPTKEDAAVRVVDERPREILHPVGVVDGRGRVRLFWIELDAGAPRVMTAVEAGERFTPPAPLLPAAAAKDSSAPGSPAPTMLHVQAVLHSDGKVWVAWDAETPASAAAPRASRDVFVASLDDDGAAGVPIAVAATPENEFEPALGSGGGLLFVAWTAWSGRDHELRLRSLDSANGKLSDPVEVSADAAADDRHPTLAAAPNGDVWIAWDPIVERGRGLSAPAPLRLEPRDDSIDLAVRVVCVRGRERFVVADPDAKAPALGRLPGIAQLSTGGARPRLGFDGAGRLWIAWRALEHSEAMRGQEGFPVLLQQLGAQGWSAPIEVERSVGFAEPAALAPLASGVTAAFQCDQRLELQQRRERHEVPPSIAAPLREQGVFLARSYGTVSIGVARAGAVAAAGAPPLVPHAASDATPPASSQRSANSPASRFEITRERATTAGAAPTRERFLVWWGDLHRHSILSRYGDGIEPGAEDLYSLARDADGCDFLAITDHSGQLRPGSWWELDKLLEAFRSPAFCPLAGYEWSTASAGHQNVILPGRLAPIVGDVLALPKLYERLPPSKALAIPHRSADSRCATDFAQVDDRFVRLIEVYQAQSGSFELDGGFKQARAATVLGGFAQDALEKGLRLGFVGGSDHGSGRAFTAIAAASLDRASLFDALQKRRTYAATTRGLLVDLRVGDAILGEEIECATPPTVRLHVRGDAELAEVVVFKNGRVWRSARGDSASSTAPTIANRLAPVQLVARIPVRSRSAAAWTLAVAPAGTQKPGARIELLNDRRGCGEEGAIAAWSLDGETATFTWPAGYGATAACAEYACHLRAAADAELQLTTPEGVVTATVAELLAQPRTFSTAAGACTLQVVAGDAAIDLVKGLGSREFDGEWQETRARSGTSWYYARVIQTDGEMAWSSPIFVTQP